MANDSLPRRGHRQQDPSRHHCIGDGEKLVVRVRESWQRHLLLGFAL